MQSIEKMITDGTAENITKKERLQLSREKAKLEKVLGGIANMSRIPAAIYMVDINHENIALAEAQRLNIQTFGMVDTNSDPTKVDFAVPANDDATKSIAIITNYLTNAIIEGLEEKANEKSEDSSDAEANANENKMEAVLEGEDGDIEKPKRRRTDGGSRKRTPRAGK